MLFRYFPSLNCYILSIEKVSSRGVLNLILNYPVASVETHLLKWWYIYISKNVILLFAVLIHLRKKPPIKRMLTPTNTKVLIRLMLILLRAKKRKKPQPVVGFN